MPKHTSLSLDNANIWLWKLTESPKQLLALLSHLPNYALEVQQFRSVKRQSEWLATRVLLHSILGDNVRIATTKREPLISPIAHQCKTPTQPQATIPRNSLF